MEFHESEFSESKSVKDWNVGLLDAVVALGTLSYETQTAALLIWPNLDGQ